MEKEQRVSGTLRKEWLTKKQRVRSRCARRISYFVGVAALGRRLQGIEMPEKPDLFKEELDQLSDQEIEARLAAAVWVDDKRASVLRYLEEKKLGKKNQARSAELEIAIAPTKRLGRLRGWRRRRTGEQTSPSQSRAWQRQQPYQQQSSPWSACILSGEILLPGAA